MSVWVKVNIFINYAPQNQELQNICLSSLNCTICIHLHSLNRCQPCCILGFLIEILSLDNVCALFNDFALGFMLLDFLIQVRTALKLDI